MPPAGVGTGWVERDSPMRDLPARSRPVNGLAVVDDVLVALLLAAVGAGAVVRDRLKRPIPAILRPGSGLAIVAVAFKDCGMVGEELVGLVAAVGAVLIALLAFKISLMSPDSGFVMVTFVRGIVV